MDTENFTFIYGRINAIEYLLQSFAISQLAQVDDRATAVKQYRDLAMRDVAKMTVVGGDIGGTQAVHAEMKAALERWFDALLKQVETNAPSPQSPWGSGKKH